MSKLPRSILRLPGYEIADQLDKKLYDNENRSYLGYSTSGSPCKRAMWYGFHWVSSEKISARTNRIFETGYRLEETIIEDLIDNGYVVIECQKEVSDETGHVQGHIDGIIEAFGQLCLLEIKTANESNYNKIVKHGVKIAKLPYYMQMQAYMSKLQLKKGLFLAYNKNDCSYYTELVDFNPGMAKDIDRIFFSILTDEQLPDKISTDPDDFECSWCSFKQVCHQGAEVAQNCRTCQNVSIEMQGVWHCNLHNFDLSTEGQKIGCMQYTVDPKLT
jgi:CRISPR/Cas system-associated exonuclease Cas4 (RecB family)